ncbi:LysR family transcriptional regulator [Komagataeibacter rhaeticus]|nr:LysR family transcriptional regulator [Komagataeibacter rhaeticus]
MDRLQAMTVFVRVVETGSFTAAARQMGMGQPAVSKIVAGLEQQLGTQLLLRSTHGLTPTDTGQRYFERVARVIADANEADALARNSLADLSGRLRVAAPTTFGRLQIIPRLGRFLSAHPRLEVDIELDDRRVDLVAEGIDVALRVGHCMRVPWSRGVWRAGGGPSSPRQPTLPGASPDIAERPDASPGHSAYTRRHTQADLSPGRRKR